ncbi:B3 domain-containing protein-like isoform X2 [Iris pallida]|uniref:B3 domain-containing protein-like isoform X2 n=1 Tax=Iris pallida TaxID=29817 RepID=A0AAX6HUJ8_IRIPA|nr:B3 domain-containing protein-like isoform X2 [Iris pallida]
MSAVDSNSYEEIRKQRIQENLKHLQGLGISKISKSLLEVAQKEQKSLKCHATPKSKKILETSELRRSSRARNPVATYQDEVADMELLSHRKRTRRSTNKNHERAYTGRIISYEDKVRAIKRAEKLQSSLKSGNPSFVKVMVRSHVSSCFWLGLPSTFCKEQLPLRELNMVLEDEDGVEYDAVYIGKRTGLSGGWRGFSIDHDLEDGDVLVFELSEPARFKIHIIKAIEERSANIDDKTVGAVGGTSKATNIEESMEKEVSQKQAPNPEPVKQAGRKTRRKHLQ